MARVARGFDSFKNYVLPDGPHVVSASVIGDDTLANIYAYLRPARAAEAPAAALNSCGSAGSRALEPRSIRLLLHLFAHFRVRLQQFLISKALNLAASDRASIRFDVALHYAFRVTRPRLTTIRIGGLAMLAYFQNSEWP